MPMAATSRTWTLEQLHSLPDDGNKYELVRGKVFVTPAPSRRHELVCARLARILDPYVEIQGLGFVFRPRALLRFEDSEAEPDLMVRREDAPHLDWDTAPVPSLIVEVLSPATRRRDHTQKRELYRDAGVADYWIVDTNARTLTALRPGEPDVVAHDVIHWSPVGATEPLDVRLSDIFGG